MRGTVSVPGDSGEVSASVSRPSEPGTPTGVAMSRVPSAADAVDLWRSAYRALRGRLRVVLLLGVMGAAVGIYAGLSMGKRLYSATGLVRIASALPAVMKETDQNRPMANFDGFLQAQREVMTGREVIDAAMKEESWIKLGARRRVRTSEQFAAGLKVDTRVRSDFLQVKFTHPDPLVAATAVQSLIAAYKQVFVREQERAERPRMEALENRRASLQGELKKLEARMAEVSRGRTLTEVEPLWAETAERARKLRNALTDVQIAIAGGSDAFSKSGDTDSATVDEGTWYLAMQSKLERELFQARSHGLLSAHPTVVRLENAIQACRTQIAAIPRTPGAPARIAERPSDVLREREGSLRTLLDSAQTEMRQLSIEREQLKSLESETLVLHQQLSDTETRLDALTTEASLGGRLAVVSGGDRPMTAMIDNRTKMAAMGGAVGGLAPMGLIVLASLVKRRYRSGEELAEDLAGRAPFVAVLPEVSGPGALGMMAARCVHDIRARLQPNGPEGSKVYLVASSSPDEGKGALAMALGFSFAAAGFRTLIVDGDLTSRGVTLSFDAGEAPGLTQAISGEDPPIQRIRAGPSILTTGRSSTLDACRLEPAALKRVLTTLRERFEVILVVGDPFLTGITSTVIAPQADSVILAVTNGQHPKRVKQTVDQVEMLGTSLSVAVFNRADPSDLPIDVKARELADKTKGRTLPEQIMRLGPLVVNVLASLRHTRAEDVELTTGAMELARTDDDATTGEQSNEATERRSRGRSAA